MINLKKSQAVELENHELEGAVKVLLSWTAGVDLDLHALTKGTNGREEHVYFGNKKGRFANLDQDSGIGARSGNNKETMMLENLKEVADVVFYVEIFGGSEHNFSKYDGKLLINFAGKPVKVDITEDKKGKYFVIAQIKNGTLININEVTSKQPSLDSVEKLVSVKEVVDNAGNVIKNVAEAGKGFIRKIGNFLSKI